MSSAWAPGSPTRSTGSSCSWSCSRRRWGQLPGPRASRRCGRRHPDHARGPGVLHRRLDDLCRTARRPDRGPSAGRVLAVSTVALPVLAWLASRLVSGVALRGGILSAGLAPAEVASVALTGLAGGEAALAAGLLAASTAVTVLLAGPILSIAGAHSSASQLGLLSTLALVVALPLFAGSALRSVDPFGGREQPVTRGAGHRQPAGAAVGGGEPAPAARQRRPRPAGSAGLPGRRHDPGRATGHRRVTGTAHRHRAAHRDGGTLPWRQASRPARSGPRPRLRWPSTGSWC